MEPEKYRVNKFYTAPTAIRSLAKEGEVHVKKHDLSSQMLLGTVGEPSNPGAWRWYHHHIGRDWCPVIDTWWQTESGGHMLTPLPGIKAAVLDDSGWELPALSIGQLAVKSGGRP
ncbi:MAG: AMP-binding protein [Thermodesulfobacteriota bacterium]|nr:AMP-binding protein [Thermodesulfobacteriota bacterium]